MCGGALSTPHLHCQLDLPSLRFPRMGQLFIAWPLGLAAEERLDSLVRVIDMPRHQLLRHLLQQWRCALVWYQTQRATQPQYCCDCNLADPRTPHLIGERRVLGACQQAANQRLALSEQLAAESFALLTQLK